MIEYRSFLNSDPPAIAEIWRSQSPSPVLMQPMTAATLDEFVFSKPYFDREGLILALDDNKPIGFVHAGFGVSADCSALDKTQGVTAMLLVAPRHDSAAIAGDLLAASESYLCRHGATKLAGGGTDLLAPFYFGLYGGSGLPGVLLSDQQLIAVYEANGYQREAHCDVFRRDLAAFRPPVNRDLMHVRRQYQLGQADDPLPAHWWDGCAFGHTDRMRFLLTEKSGHSPVAEASFWDIEPLASSWRVHAMGLVSFQISQDHRSSVVATFFLGEILRQLGSYGTTLVEIQAKHGESLLADAGRKLGFEPFDQGFQFSKSVA